MLNFLENEDEENLMLELLEDFLHLNIELYSKRIINGLKLLLNSSNGIKSFYILPLLAEEDLNKNKSSRLIHYLFKGTTFKHTIPILQNFKILVVDDINDQRLSNLKEDQHIVLVDDFIGTGETAISAVNYLIKTHPQLKNNNISVLTIVIQKSGIEALFNKKINVFYSIPVGKGISDKFNAEEKEKRLELMNNIENRLKVKPKFKLGYKQSEALVCMERTPNNTFPIFWSNNKKTNFAPFPR